MTVRAQISDFELHDETGTLRRLTTLLAGGPVVLFFYPIASSGGCTREACHFRDLAAEFAAAGAQPVGISSDAVAAQRTFAAAHSLGYPLLSTPITPSPKSSAPTEAGCPAGCTPADAPT